MLLLPHLACVPPSLVATFERPGQHNHTACIVCLYLCIWAHHTACAAHPCSYCLPLSPPQTGVFIPEKSNIWRDCCDGMLDWVKEHVYEASGATRKHHTLQERGRRLPATPRSAQHPAGTRLAPH